MWMKCLMCNTVGLFKNVTQKVRLPCVKCQRDTLHAVVKQ